MSYGGGAGSRCLTSIRFNMEATILRQDDIVSDPANPDQYGEWVKSQDPLTKEIVREWKAAKTGDGSVIVIPCVARGIVDGGIRVAGTTERFSDIYENVDFIKMWIPTYVTLTKRDRITNVKDATGKIVWLDEESGLNTENNPKATVFNVNGVTSLFDAFNNEVERFALLEKAEVD